MHGCACSLSASSLTISFTHPHPPFVAPREHWNRYCSDEIDAPRVAPIVPDKLDPHSRWLYHAHAQDEHSVRDAQVRNARHAYYAMASYIDDKVGRVMKALAQSLAEVAASSDLYSNWAFQPFVDASKRYIRGAGSAGPTNAKSQARFPYVAALPPDRKA